MRSLEVTLDPRFWRTTITAGLSATSTEIYSELTTIDLLSNQCLLTLDGTLDIDEISVGESSRLASTSVNGNTDIDDVSDVTEELIEISVRHLKGEVADEEGLRGFGLSRSTLAALVHVVDNETATFNDGLVLGLNGLGGLFDVFELDVSESVVTLLADVRLFGKVTVYMKRL